MDEDQNEQDDQEPTNPLVNIREDSGYSQQELAQLAGMTSNAIVRYEQALYLKPSLDYLQALWQIDVAEDYLDEDIKFGVAWYMADYAKFRSERVLATTNLFSRAVETQQWMQQVASKVEWEVHPFVAFRKMLAVELGLPNSQIHFCILTCFHPGQLDYFEKGRTSNIPGRLRRILLNAGQDVDTLEREISRYLGSD